MAWQIICIQPSKWLRLISRQNKKQCTPAHAPCACYSLTFHCVPHNVKGQAWNVRSRFMPCLCTPLTLSPPVCPFRQAVKYPTDIACCMWELLPECWKGTVIIMTRKGADICGLTLLKTGEKTGCHYARYYNKGTAAYMTISHFIAFINSPWKILEPHYRTKLHFHAFWPIPLIHS